MNCFSRRRSGALGGGSRGGGRVTVADEPRVGMEKAGGGWGSNVDYSLTGVDAASTVDRSIDDNFKLARRRISKTSTETFKVMEPDQSESRYPGGRTSSLPAERLRSSASRIPKQEVRSHEHRVRK